MVLRFFLFSSLLSFIKIKDYWMEQDDEKL